MACFLVPAGEAIVTTVLTKAFKSLEKSKQMGNDHVVDTPHTEISYSSDIELSSDEKVFRSEEIHGAAAVKTPFSKKLSWLNNMLWGGSALLAFEHVWHGEVVAWFPFLTAMESHEEAMAMLHEMSTVGVSMAALVTAVWGVMVLASDVIMKRQQLEDVEELQ